MNFEYTVQRIVEGSSALEYFQVPWDSELCGFPVGQVASFHLKLEDEAEQLLARLVSWKEEAGIRFSSCRLPHSAMARSLILQKHGYRFVELNYRPERKLEAEIAAADAGHKIEAATQEQQSQLVDWAATAFESGRFHVDPQLGATVGNRRYRAWMLNAFERSHQQVVTCQRSGETEAFFVIEQHEAKTSFWSLVGLRPDLKGRGLAKSVWTAMLEWERRRGMKRVVTSISSLNTPILNLYARLGFRFPEPNMTLHWHA